MTNMDETFTRRAVDRPEVKAADYTTWAVMGDALFARNRVPFVSVYYYLAYRAFHQTIRYPNLLWQLELLRYNLPQCLQCFGDLGVHLPQEAFGGRVPDGPNGPPPGRALGAKIGDETYLVTQHVPEPAILCVAVG